MGYKKFLIPVSAAIAALISPQTQAVPASSSDKATSDEAKVLEQLRAGESHIVVQKLMYSLGEDEHALVLHRSTSGALYAQHGSHQSHGSHGSHRSHRSGY